MNGIEQPFWVIVNKEIRDHVRSWRFIILLAIITLTCLGALYTSLTSMHEAVKSGDVEDTFFFLKLFTVSDGTLPSFVLFINFLGPVLTTLIMMIFFREKKSPWRIAAIALAVSGVFFLSHGDTTGTVTLLGIFIVLLSALGYALYLVTVSQLKSLEMKGLKMTFYVFLFGGILLFTGMTVTGVGVQAIPDRITLGNLVMLALVPTVISNLALVRAIKNIGSTLTSVLGAMEPVTAVCVGILIFGEPFTQSIALGIGLIISAVTVIILKK